jgi:acetyl-CoA synthetase (ADP-forming)
LNEQANFKIGGIEGSNKNFQRANDILTERIKKIISQARKENRTFLLEPEAKTIMKELSIPTSEFKVASNPEEAKKIGEELGYPVAMKIVSPQVVHKTDAGGVKLNLNSASEVKDAFKTIKENVQDKNSSAKIKGMLIEPMAKPSTEIIVGVTRDPTFGPALMFGLGGIFVEILKDVSFRIAPITKDDALEMIHEIKALPMLQGFRGGPNVDLSLIVDVLLKISNFCVNFQEDIQEIDLNPIFAYDNKLLTVDARIILTEK